MAQPIHTYALYGLDAIPAEVERRTFRTGYPALQHLVDLSHL
jgi:hypothetical protein